MDALSTVDTLTRVQRWAENSISIDVTTMILRSEGVPDEQIRHAYDTVAQMPGYEVSVERGIATITYLGLQ
jgi:hypothetical protein